MGCGNSNEDTSEPKKQKVGSASKERKSNTS
jgi:hypothetical protein